MTRKTAVETASAYVSKREAARARRDETTRLKRERTEELRRKAAARNAEQRERVAEAQAPQIQRQAIVTATVFEPPSIEFLGRGNGRKVTPGKVKIEGGIVLREPFAEPDVKRGGYRRANPLVRMHRADPKMVTRTHLAAARKFSEDYEKGELGASMAGGMSTHLDGGDAPGPLDHQFAAMKRYREACDAMGPTLRSAVQLAVLHKWPVSRIAPAMGMSDERASGWLLGGLDRLADHYWPNRATRADMVERALLVDAAITDVPQDRLGRRARAA
jgi:hypothetical protein